MIVDIDKKTLAILNNEISGKQPEPRSDHCAVILEDKMYIMGGKNVDENLQYNDLWCFDIE